MIGSEKHYVATANFRKRIGDLSQIAHAVVWVVWLLGMELDRFKF